MSSSLSSTRGRGSADEPVPFHDQREDVARLRRLIEHMLEGPWSSTEAWARSLACAEVNHPRIRGEADKACYCGKVKP